MAHAALESDLARPWTLTALAEELHLAPAYLVRLYWDHRVPPQTPVSSSHSVIRSRSAARCQSRL